MKYLSLLLLLSVVGCGSDPELRTIEPYEIMAEHIYCKDNMEGYFKHEIWVFSDESVMSSCMIANSAISGSGMSWFSKDQRGARVAGCMMVFDVDEPTQGFWDFQLAAGDERSYATYHDPSSAYDETKVQLHCVKN